MRQLLPTLWLAACAYAAPVQVYVASGSTDTVGVIDADSGRPAGEIRLGGRPRSLAVSPDGTRLYVSAGARIDVVDTRSRKVIRQILLSSAGTGIALALDGTRLYAALPEQSRVEIIDTASFEVLKTIVPVRDPGYLFASPDGGWVFAPSTREGRLTAISTKTEEPEFEIALPSAARSVAMELNREGLIRRLFVPLSGVHGLAVVNFADRSLIGNLKLPAAPPDTHPLLEGTLASGSGVDPSGKTLWVASMLDNSISVYSLPDLVYLGGIPTGAAPYWLAFGPSGRRCFVSNAGSSSVSVLDVATRQELARIPAGRSPRQLVTAEVP